MKSERVFHRTSLSIALTIGLTSVQAHAAQEVSDGIETVTIIGTKENARELAGSASVVGSDQIDIELATDINQLLKTVPGVYIREEDGNGLRPNIGIRGATSERSSKITVLEDGVLIAPAPYSAPEAYFFPTAARMRSVEVLKGAPLLRYGPQTTGGVINLVSTQIPDELGGRVAARIGEFNSRDLIANVGGTSGSLGWLLESVQRDSDGFKDIDRSNRDAGYEIADYVGKLAWNQGPHSLALKAQYSEETSHETYLGLSDADFNVDEDRRYGISAIDRMDNDHQSLSARYTFEFDADTSVSVLAYRNEFERDWFKLSGGGSLVDKANAGDALAQAQLDGDANIIGLTYKHNSREYVSEGAEINLTTRWSTHAFELGARLHEDEVDRFQPVEIWDQIDGALIYRETIAPGSGDNRIEDANATSFWITDAWSVSDTVLLNMSLRHESVETSARRYPSPDRSDITGVSSSDVDEWLPGVSATWSLNDNWEVLAGVHRGFSPLGGGAQPWEDPETSINYEAGMRYNTGNIFIEAIAFHSDFDNKSESCSVARPCSNGATFGSFTTGEARIRGVEFQASMFLSSDDLSFPIDISYTYTDAQISEDNAASGVESGDLLADVPEHAWSIRAGVESSAAWSAYAVTRYIDDMCVSVGCNRSDSAYRETESLLVTDFLGHFDWSDALRLSLKLENAFDARSIVSRAPEGARPNRPRAASVGVEYRF